MHNKAYNADHILDELIAFSLAEDLSTIGDITSDALIDPQRQAEVSIVTRADGVVSGVKTLEQLVKKVDDQIELEIVKNDSEAVEKSQPIACLRGSLKSILLLERTALNFLSHLSGIATNTRKYVEVVKQSGSSTIIRDTRKTLPGYRALEKEAVIHGGGQNHRMGLYDAFLVKDNHISFMDLDVVAKRCREFSSEALLEIEVDSIEQLKVVIQYNPDLILLDNFTVEEVKHTIEFVGDIELEISGGVNLENLAQYASTGVKYIAVGAITHSSPILDLGFDIS